MGKYLRKFETTASYDAAKDGLIKPNVSYIVEGNGVEYNPYVPPRPTQIITYNASAKLAEVTSEYYGRGVRPNAFSGASGQLTMTSHTFENGVGTIEFNDDVISIGNYAFYMSTELTSIEIPDSVTSIGDYAFAYCGSRLTRLNSDTDGVFNIPSGVTSIGRSAFYYCDGLTSIVIPSGITSINQGVFSHCGGLTSVTIPNSVTSIGNTAFDSCSGMTSIEIPDSVTSIDNYAFQGCSKLTSITSLATTAPTIQSYTFQNVKTGGTLTVPSGSSGYDVWMGTGNYYLGKYNWSKVEQ